MNIAALTSFADFLKKIKKYGNLTALSTANGEITYTYDQLISAIEKTSCALQNVIKPRQRIILYKLHGPHHVITLLAAVCNGNIVVPLDSRMSPALQKDIIKNTGAKLAITCNSNVKLPLEILVFEKLLKTRRSYSNSPPQKLCDPIEILYTSGTWGKPKGVVLTAQNLLSNLTSILSVYRPVKEEKLLSVLPLAHAYEQMCGLLVPLYSGCHIIYQEQLDRLSLMQSFEKYPITYMVVVPKFLEIFERSILEKTKKYNAAFDTLITFSMYIPYSIRGFVFKKVHNFFGKSFKNFIVGGAALNDSTSRLFRGLGFGIFVGYGLTEAAPVLTISLDKRLPSSCVGLTIPGVKLTHNKEGEIVAEGPNISPGYWPLSKNIQTKLTTGDLGYFDYKKRLILTGRRKNIIVFSTGDKINMEDIERMANKFPGIKESCVIYKQNLDKLVYVLIYTGDCNEEKFHAFLNCRLPFYARIPIIRKWGGGQLPRTHTLKIQREIIAEKFVTNK
jgi:long-chain acyl-CoA synthetase